MLGPVTGSQESSPFTAMEDVKSISLVPESQLNPEPMGRPPAPAAPRGTGLLRSACGRPPDSIIIIIPDAGRPGARFAQRPLIAAAWPVPGSLAPAGRGRAAPAP